MNSNNSFLANNKYSSDTFLGGHLIIKQPTVGFRAGTDSVLLASIVNSSNNKSAQVLDLGCGVGTVSLCLAFRCKNLIIQGIEINPLYAELAKLNIIHNNFPQISIHNKNLKTLSLPCESFDIVVSNPPFFKKNTVNSSPSLLKNQGNIESTATLKDFIDIAFKYLVPKGFLYIIQHTSRLKDVLDLLSINKFGFINIYPIYSFAKESATRFIISAQKFSKKPLILQSGIILHNSNNTFTNEAINILQKGKEFPKL